LSDLLPGLSWRWSRPHYSGIPRANPSHDVRSISARRVRASSCLPLPRRAQLRESQNQHAHNRPQALTRRSSRVLRDCLALASLAAAEPRKTAPNRRQRLSASQRPWQRTVDPERYSPHRTKAAVSPEAVLTSRGVPSAVCCRRWPAVMAINGSPGGRHESARIGNSVGIGAHTAEESGHRAASPQRLPAPRLTNSRPPTLARSATRLASAGVRTRMRHHAASRRVSDRVDNRPD